MRSLAAAAAYGSELAPRGVRDAVALGPTAATAAAAGAS